MVLSLRPSLSTLCVYRKWQLVAAPECSPSTVRGLSGYFSNRCKVVACPFSVM